MFVRSVKIKSSSGDVHEYVRVVASYRDESSPHPKQKTIANLGRRDLLEEILPMLSRFLNGESCSQRELHQLGQHDFAVPMDASTWGPMLVTRFLFDKLSLWQLLEQLDTTEASQSQGCPVPRDWISRVSVLVANRLSEQPSSEHGLAAWLESDYICDREGRRYLADWREHGRVKVSFAQLQRWYRTLDQLFHHKEAIEVGLFERLRDLFSLKPKLVFYDITSTYFEGHGPSIAKHGYSRDGKPRKVQVIVGMVMVAGWPIAHHVWQGNTKDQSTVSEVIEDLTERFDFERVVFVGDRGMVSQANLDLLKGENNGGDDAGGYGYVLGMVRRRNPIVEELIDQADAEGWIECPVGITASEKNTPPRTCAQEVKGPEQAVRYIVVESEERLQYEQAMRKKSMERVAEALEKVRLRVKKGRLKNPSKIGAAVERALKRSHGHRYYDWELKDGELSYFEHPVHLKREKKYEGKYLIQTDQSDMDVCEVVQSYKDLNEVERGFRSLKNPISISMRPVYHRAEDRVRAHIFVAALAFLLERFVEKSLKDAGAKLSARDAFKALQTVRHVTFRLSNGEERTGVTPGTNRARQVLKILGINELNPPTPKGQKRPCSDQ